MAREWYAQGKLRLAGAYDPPTGGALLVFEVASPAEVEAFVASDPYVKNGVVTGHRIRPWNVVIGS